MPTSFATAVAVLPAITPSMIFCLRISAAMLFAPLGFVGLLRGLSFTLTPLVLALPLAA
jgi:hypothetical protein